MPEIHYFRSPKVGQSIKCGDAGWVRFSNHLARATPAQATYLRNHPRWKTLLSYLGDDPKVAAEKFVNEASAIAFEEGNIPPWAPGQPKKRIRQENIEGAVREILPDNPELIVSPSGRGGVSTADLAGKTINPAAPPSKTTYTKRRPASKAAREKAAAEGTAPAEPVQPEKVEDPPLDAGVLAAASKPLSYQQQVRLMLADMQFPRDYPLDQAFDDLLIPADMPEEHVLIMLRAASEEGRKYEPREDENAPDIVRAMPSRSAIGRMKKAELVALCEKHALPSEGTAKALKERLLNLKE